MIQPARSAPVAAPQVTALNLIRIESFPLEDFICPTDMPLENLSTALRTLLGSTTAPVQDSGTQTAENPATGLTQRDMQAARVIINRLMTLANKRRTLQVTGASTALSQQSFGVLRRHGVPANNARNRNPLLQPLKQEAASIVQSFRQHVPPGVVLTNQQTAFRNQVHTLLAQETAGLWSAVREAGVAQWSAFERGCFLAAVAHWSREKANRRIRPIIPADAPEWQRRRLATQHIDEPFVKLYLFAEWQLQIHQHDMYHPQTGTGRGSSLSRQMSEALNLLSWACANTPELTPPIIQRKLRSLHRYMISSVAASVRMLEDARVLSLDYITAERENTVGGRQVRPQRTNTQGPKPQLALALDRTLSWLSPGSDTITALINAMSYWIGERNRKLLFELSKPLRINFSIGHYDYLKNISPPENLLQLFPPAYSEIIQQQSSAQQGAQNAARNTIETELNSLFCWFHDHKVNGYLLPGNRIITRDTVANPESRWVNLTRKISDLYDGLQQSGFQIRGRNQHISVSTYGGHKVVSYDLGMPPRTNIQIARPSLLYIGSQTLGDSPGAPRGVYQSDGWYITNTDRSSPLQELLDKWQEGYLGSLGGFTARWNQYVSTLSVTLRTRITGSRKIRNALRQFLLVADDTTIPATDRAFLLNGVRHGQHPRQPEAELFLAGIFFEDSVMRGVSSNAAQQFREGVRSRLYAAIQIVWDSHRPASWTAFNWDAVLRHVFTDSMQIRGQHLAWAAAVLNNEAYLDSLSVVLGFVSAITELTPARRSELRILFNQALQEIKDITQVILDNYVTTNTEQREFHHYVTDFISRSTLPVPDSNNKINSSNHVAEDVSSNADEDGSGLGLSENHAQGAMTVINHQYRLIMSENRHVQPNQLLFIRIEFMHMTSVATNNPASKEPTELSIASPLVMENSPLLGSSGTSGNAPTPHTHLQLTIWANMPNPATSRPIGLLSPFDFFGPLQWMGSQATGNWPPHL